MKIHIWLDVFNVVAFYWSVLNRKQIKQIFLVGHYARWAILQYRIHTYYCTGEQSGGKKVKKQPFRKSSRKTYDRARRLDHDIPAPHPPLPVSPLNSQFYFGPFAKIKPNKSLPLPHILASAPRIYARARTAIRLLAAIPLRTGHRIPIYIYNTYILYTLGPRAGAPTPPLSSPRPFWQPRRTAGANDR